jgi:hypothetical protein
MGLLRRKLSKMRCSFQSKVDDFTLMAVLHCGGNSSVKNCPFREPGHIPLCVSLHIACSYLDGDRMFCLYVCRGLLLGTAAVNMNG